MKQIYLDCRSGISGDKLLGACVDAGVPLAYLQAHMDALGKDIRLRAKKVRRASIGGTRVSVHFPKQAKGIGTLAAVKTLLQGASLPPAVKKTAVAVFQRMAKAEAKVHHHPLTKVHFHEMDSLDTLADVVGSVSAIQYLKPEKVFSSAVDTGKGTVQCAHGTMPVPAPGTMELLKGIPIRTGDMAFELTTPTGAALLAEMVDTFGDLPECHVERIGYGAGTMDFRDTPNLLRMLLIATAQPDDSDSDEVLVLECDVDDMTGEWTGRLFESLEDRGALDISILSTIRKKNRPGWRISVVCHPRHEQRILKQMFTDTTTFGIRRHRVQRSKLKRKIRNTDTVFGPIRIKTGYMDGHIVTITPEYEDCRKAARLYNVSLKEVYHQVYCKAAQS